MTRDELEFSISQYLDGTLPAADRDALETRLGSDAEARAIYAEYEALQGVLAAAPVPAVRWDRLAEEISAAVAREEMPAQSYKLSRWLRPVRLAVAASVLLAGGIAFTLLRTAGDPASGPAPAPADITRIVIKTGTAHDGDAPGAATTAAPAVVNTEPVHVAIGPPAAGDAAPVRLYADDGVVSRRSRVVIVSAAPLGQDSPQPF
jgi:anti-sigma factor RsiW